MTHTILRDGDIVAGVLCIERAIGTCIILMSDPDEADKLVAIAKAQKVEEVKMLVPEQWVLEMESRDWTLRDDLKVMVKKA